MIRGSLKKFKGPLLMYRYFVTIGIVLCVAGTSLKAQPTPAIYSLSVDESRNELTIHGLCGQPKGRVHINGLELAVREWLDTVVRCEIPSQGWGSAGPVVVTSSYGRTSAPHLLSLIGIREYHYNDWNGNLKFYEFLRLSVHLYYRCDLEMFNSTDLSTYVTPTRFSYADYSFDHAEYDGHYNKQITITGNGHVVNDSLNHIGATLSLETYGKEFSAYIQSLGVYGLSMLADTDQHSQGKIFWGFPEGSYFSDWSNNFHLNYDSTYMSNPLDNTRKEYCIWDNDTSAFLPASLASVKQKANQEMTIRASNEEYTRALKITASHASAGAQRIEIVNELGQRVYEQSFESSGEDWQITMPAMHAGVYFVKVVSGDRIAMCKAIAP